MAIEFHKESQTFHLHNAWISYIFKVLPSGHLGQLYYGRAIHDRPDFDHLFETAYRSMSVHYFDGEPAYSLEHIKQEYPTCGTGDIHLPALDAAAPNGSRLLDLHYQSHTIAPGKPPLEGGELPSTYVESPDEAVTLTVTLADALAGVTVDLVYTLYEGLPVLTRHAVIGYTGEGTLRLDRAMSFCLDLPDMDYDLVELTGAWARERHVVTRPLAHGVQGVYSLRGCSSHHFNPFLALKRHETTEFAGEVYGFSLVYSGNFAAQADVDPYHVTRVTMGIHPQGFRWDLHSGERFTTPEAVLVYSEQGLNEMSQTYHQLYRTRLARGEWRDKVRPILVNNWEATYFDFTEEKLLGLAAEAKRLGIELFVLDDGWFTNRNDDHGGLGDWQINYEKLPDGIQGFGAKLHEMGLLFGLWIEPEMVNAGTALWNEHPDWVLHEPGRRPQQGRFQYVLDYSNPAVVDWIFARPVQRAGRRADRLHQVGHEPQHQRRLFLHGGQRCPGHGAAQVHPGGVPAVPAADRALPPHPVRVLRFGRGPVRPGDAGLRAPVLDQRRHRRGGAAAHPVRHLLRLSRVQHGGPCGRHAQPSGGPDHLSDHAGQRGHFRGLWL